MINDKQFFISCKYDSYKDWKRLNLADGYALVYEPKLRVQSNADGSAVLLGNAWQVKEGEQSPADIVAHLAVGMSLEQVYELEQSWCGRYVLIYDGRVLLDNCGMLGVYYSEEIVTSSLRVMCEVTGRKMVYPDVRLGLSPNFVPGPLTNYEGVRQLLPSQVLNYATLETVMRPLLPDGATEYETEQERTQAFLNMFVTSLRNMRKQFPDEKIVVALTGGKDSRLLMAMMEYAGLDYELITAWHDRITEGDKDIPKELARVVGRKHTLLMRREYSEALADDYLTHTAGYAKDQDINFWAYGQYQQMQPEGEPVLLLRSSIWECSDDHYRHFTNPLDLYRQFPYARENELLHRSFEEWKQIVAADPYNKDINIWTRLFWDQREGCWLSALEQGYDMMDSITSIQPCNCRALLSTLMGYDEAERFLKIHEDKIMRLACEKLTRVAYDKSYNGYSLKPHRDALHRTAYFVKYRSISAGRFARRAVRYAMRRVLGRS